MVELKYEKGRELQVFHDGKLVEDDPRIADRYIIAMMLDKLIKNAGMIQIHISDAAYVIRLESTDDPNFELPQALLKKGQW